MAHRLKNNARHWPLEEHPLQISHKRDWSRSFILLPPHTAVLLGSDIGSDYVKTALAFVIQNLQTSYAMWCLMYGAHY